MCILRQDGVGKLPERTLRISAVLAHENQPRIGVPSQAGDKGQGGDSHVSKFEFGVAAVEG